jgi:hypothetical protein
MGKADICSALGISPKSWGTIKKAAGDTLKSEGEKASTVYFWK